ncbi:MAG: hypothetical protein Q8Q23_03520 [bacterium]|nr:hypothetical protein [bacterium]
MKKMHEQEISFRDLEVPIDDEYANLFGKENSRAELGYSPKKKGEKFFVKPLDDQTEKELQELPHKIHQDVIFSDWYATLYEISPRYISDLYRLRSIKHLHFIIFKEDECGKIVLNNQRIKNLNKN